MILTSFLAQTESSRMGLIDILLFLIAVVLVIGFGIRQGKKEEAASSDSGGAAGYFLAGRGLTWWLVGFSLIAANISTEQFVGMSGQAANWLGMAIASYEWMAAATLVVTAFVFLPKLLKCGIYTIPEFLQYRYGKTARYVMAISTLIILVGIPTASVIYSGAKVISVFFAGINILGLDLGNITVGCWIIGLSAAIYVFVGGLRACAWTDLIWGAGLIVGGAVVMWLALSALKSADPNDLIQTKVANSSATVADLENATAIDRFMLLNDGKNGEAVAQPGTNLNGGKLHMKRPISDSDIPWTALLLGLWIPNFFYWGLNQYIVQRTLGSKSLAEGQKGIVFAAALKLIIPFIVVIPGILCFNLYHKDLLIEGQKKNQDSLTVLKNGDAKLIPMHEDFVKLEPETALLVLAHNAKVSQKEIPSYENTPAAISAANNEIAKGNGKDLVETGKLIGYDYDAAFPMLLRKLMKPGITWFVLASIFGAVVSSLASMLNSASTIATMDIYQACKPSASESSLVGVGKFFTMVFVVISCFIAPNLGKFDAIFKYIQEFQGFISPGILVAFLFGFLVPRAPRYFGVLSILLNVVLYAAIKWVVGPWLCASNMWFSNEISFLDRMGVCFIVIVIVGLLATALNPLKEPVILPVTDAISLESSKTAKIVGAFVIVAMIILYAMFW